MNNIHKMYTKNTYIYKIILKYKIFFILLILKINDFLVIFSVICYIFFITMKITSPKIHDGS